MCATMPSVTSRTEAAAGAPADEASSQTFFGESRWPPAVAALVYTAVNIAVRVWLPSEAPVRVPWLVPAIEENT